MAIEKAGQASPALFILAQVRSDDLRHLLDIALGRVGIRADVVPTLHDFLRHSRVQARQADQQLHLQPKATNTMSETPRKSPSDPPNRTCLQERGEIVAPRGHLLALPSTGAGSGTRDRRVETAWDYARQAASGNTLKAYAKD